MADDLTPASAPDQTPPSAPATDAVGSLADHERQYSGRNGTEPETPPAELPPEPDVAEPEPAPAEGERERDEKGRFQKTRHRAASQQATPDDVPRIQNLSARLRAVEAERDALKAQVQPRPAPEPAKPTPAPVAAKPKPTPDQFSDWNDYTEALTDWKIDQKWATLQQEQRQQAERERIETSWAVRRDAARERYPDFDAVALQTETRIPAGSLVDAWILEHKAGADVLYQLQKDPKELDRLLSLPLFEQAESLALMSQRSNGSSRTAAAVTGSAPALPAVPTPRPPNPVRTGSLKAGDEPPGDGASLADHERYYPFRRPRGG